MTYRIAVALLLAGCGDDGGARHLPDAPAADSSADAPIDGDTSACAIADFDVGSARGLVSAGDGTVYFTQGTNVGRVLPCQPAEPAWVNVGVTGLTSLMVDPPNHALYVAALSGNTVYRIDLAAATPTAVAYASVDDPEGLTLGPDGALWSTTNDGVVRIDAANSVTAVTKTALNNPKGLAFRADGSLLVLEYSGAIVSFQIANNVEASHGIFADGSFGGIIGIALDAAGNVFITQGDGGPFLVVLDATGAVIDTSEEGLASQLDFGAGPLTHSDLYVAGAARVARTVAGATVPWHAL